MCFLAFGVSGTAGLSFFKLSTESQAIFTLGRTWTTTCLFDESKVDCSLIEGNGSRDKTCNGTNVGVGVPVGLTGLVVRVESLVDSRGQ
jgi:hypothetical protein